MDLISCDVPHKRREEAHGVDEKGNPRLVSRVTYDRSHQLERREIKINKYN